MADVIWSEGDTFEKCKHPIGNKNDTQSAYYQALFSVKV